MILLIHSITFCRPWSHQVFLSGFRVNSRPNTQVAPPLRSRCFLPQSRALDHTCLGFGVIYSSSLACSLYK